MKKNILFLISLSVIAIILIGLLMLRHKSKTNYLDTSLSVEKRIENLLELLTTEEKVSLCHANSKFTIAGIERLGIPELTMSDGPNGVREECKKDSWGSAGSTDDSSTALPTQTLLACTWNTQLARSHGEVLGSEARFRKKNIILAPGINIIRTPLNGRNFEYMSEDPFLISKLVIEHIKGVQSQGTAACVKHFLANNQEYERNIVNVQMDERALREIYLPGFKAAIEKAGALCVMGAYNKFRGEHCCHNKYLLKDILKGEMKFKGLVMSDWDGCHSTQEAVNNGLDIEMGTEGKKYNDFYLAGPFLKGLKNRTFSKELLDEKVRRILYVMFQTQMADHKDTGEINTPGHQRECLKEAQEGMVLLKNKNNLLPLNSAKIKSIAVIGQNATIKHAYGGGSSYIKALYEITPLEGLQRKVGNKIKLNIAQGYQISDSSDRKTLIKEAIEAAKKSDVALVCVGLTHVANNIHGQWRGYDSEGMDNASWQLPWGENELINAVVKANPKTIVVLISGTAVSVKEWIDNVAALLYTSYAGMEMGNALASLIFGDVNPSGKLSYTFPVRLEDSPAHAQSKKQYPGVNHTVTYSEGIYVGYRWYESKNINPMFAFGFGLSYTTFKFSDLTLSADKIKATDSLIVSLNVTNTGKRQGGEVVQLYIHDEVASVDRPYKELKGFSKVFLQSGETKKVTLTIDKDALSFWDIKSNRFYPEPGKFKLMIGNSSKDILLEKEFELVQ